MCPSNSSEPCIVYGNIVYHIGDEVELYMQFSAKKGTYIARDDTGLVILPEMGSRMIPEMIVNRVSMVEVRAKIIKIVETKRKTKYVLVRPIEWKPVTYFNK